MKVEDYYKAKPKMDSLEEVVEIAEPISDILNKLQDPDYSYEGTYYSKKDVGDNNKCNIRLMNGTKTLFKIDNKNTAITLLKSIMDTLNNMQNSITKEVSKI